MAIHLRMIVALLTAAAANSIDFSTHGPKAVPNAYIVGFLDDYSGRSAVDKVEEWLADVDGVDGNQADASGEATSYYNAGFNGVALRNISPSTYERIQKDEIVKFIQPQYWYYPQAQVQSPVDSWGIDRIDQKVGTDNSYRWFYSGVDVDVFVLDTGVRDTHVEFRPQKIKACESFVTGETDCRDTNGHGTHVAGIIAGTTYGVAKNAGLYIARIFDSQGRSTTQYILDALDWVRRYQQTNPEKRVVVNLSFAANVTDTAIDASIADLVETNNVVAVASAGNYLDVGADACQFTPARSPNTITVGAVTVDDRRSSFSNFGPCVDIFAPGSAIKSAASTDDTATRSLSGTSLATPHVTGVVAQILHEHRFWSPDRVKEELLNGAVDVVTNEGEGSPTLLLNNQDTIDECRGFFRPCNHDTLCCSGRCVRFLDRCSLFGGLL